VDCPAGYSCPANTIYPVICPIGSYCLAASAAPTKCPAGTYAPTTGTNSLAGCLPCGFGYYSTASGSSVCLACPINTNTTVTNANLASQCVCDPGYYMTGGVCIKCPHRTYSARGAVASCTPCPANSNTSGIGSSTFFQCLCVGGYYGEIASASSTGCQQCVANSYCAGMQVNLIATCPDSLYSLAGSSSVSQCKCPVNAMLLPAPLSCTCNNGTYKVLNQSAPLGGWQCDSCPATKYCQVGNAVDCPAGSYCPVNTIHPIICPIGSYCVAASAAPTQCPAGTFVPTTGSSSLGDCLQCGHGYYSIAAGSSVCSACQVNSNTTVTNANLVSQCICDPGYYMSAQQICTKCSIGSYSSSAGAVSACTPCPASSNTLALGSSAYSQCLCVAGYAGEITSPSSLGCKTCVVNNYCPGSQVNHTIVCPNSTFSLAGASLESQCMCPSNATVVDSQSGCVCKGGTYKVMNPASLLSGWQCDVCPPKSYCANNDRTSCPAGYYCPQQSVSPIICPAGAYCLESVSAPTLCPAGTYNAHEGATTEEEGCIPCGYGFYTTAPGATQCSVCQIHSNTTVLIAQSKSQCVCDAGYTMKSGDVCQPCGFGTYSAQGASSQCTSCPAHSNTTNMSSTTVSDCICGVGYTANISGGCRDCPADSYCPGGGLSIVCPNNQYSLSGSVTESQCRCPDKARLTPDGCICNNGFSREANAAAPLAGWQCAPCAKGYVCIDGGTIECPSGYYCVGENSTLCPAGSYCSLGASVPTPCSPGESLSSIQLYFYSYYYLFFN
jgi:hypothetical protein